MQAQDLVELYNESRDQLENLHKNVKELVISMDAIQLHFPNIEMGELKLAIASKQSKMDELSNIFEKLQATRMSMMREYIASMSKEYTQYRLLKQLDERTAKTIEDPFLVEMSKLIYPCINHQIRPDPLISHDCKVGTLNSSNLSDTIEGTSGFQSICTNQSSANQCNFAAFDPLDEHVEKDV